MNPHSEAGMEMRPQPLRVDPLTLYPWLGLLSARELGALAGPRLDACIGGRATLLERHVLDAIGCLLRSRELWP